MKKTGVLLTALIAGAFIASEAGAQTPSSNTKTVTGGLIEDGLVDSIDTGVKGKNVLFFGGYDKDSNLIQAGAGKRAGKRLWFSLYDGWYMNASTENTESVTNDAYAEDGVNIDYTDHSSSSEIRGSSRVKNNLAFSSYIDDKIGGTFYWNIDSTKYNGYSLTDPTAELSDLTAAATTRTTDESHADNTESVLEYSALENIKSSNTFGIAFNGLKTPYFLDDYKLYFKLNSISFKKESRYIDIAWSEKSTLNGSTVDSNEQPVYSGLYDFNTYTPAFEAEAGFTFRKLWDFVTPSFKLIENFETSFKSNESSYSYSRYTTNTNAQSVLEQKSYSLEQGDWSSWKNTLTPRFDFGFDAGEGIKLKARAQAAVSFGNTASQADCFTTVTTETTTNKITGDIEKIKTTVSRGGKDKDTETFTTSVNPSFKIGLVYEVIPSKFNITMGVTASSGTLTWKTETVKNSYIPETETVTETDVFGGSVTSSGTSTPANGDEPGLDDAVAETEKTTFASTAPSATARFGFMWFLGEKAQLDTFLIYGTSAGTTAPTWAMNVMFGVRF
ncbi:MAG: hypothetical protein J5780_04515 [Treponema sp.]|nr:hypothetical protein [Treponema sp.]